MDAYFLNRQISKLSDSQTIEAVENKVYANERFNNKEKHINKIINNSTFATMGFKNNSFDDCTFNYCTFINCYFRDAKFTNVVFVGCKFIDCNFTGTTYINCDFRYANFKDCFINYDDLKFSLPREENLRWRLCTNLSIECLNLGSDDEYKKYYFEEKKATEKYNIEIFLRRQPYYKKKYGGWDALVALTKVVLGKLNQYLWGYGEKLRVLLLNIFIVVFLSSFFYYNAGNVFKVNGNSLPMKLNFAESMYLSVCNFTTVTSDITSSATFVRYFTVFEGFLGLTLMGFFIAALFRYINRR